jgi:carbamoyl-phosphate synthase large subunit
VHSGDATLVLPPQRTYLETMRRIKKTSARIASSLQLNGPFNIRFIAKGNEVSVIECNVRASRSFPFVSKILKSMPQF